MVAASHLEPKPGITASNKCDSNVDTCCLRKNLVILEYTRITADVSVYDKSIKPIEDVPIVNGATAWDDPVLNQTYIIIVNEDLYYGTKIDHYSLNPNQIRHYGLNFWDNSYDKERGLNIKLDDSVEVTMRTKGTKIYFKKKVSGQSGAEGLSKVTTHEPQRMELYNSVTGRIEVQYQGSSADDAHISNENFTKYQRL